MTDRRRGPRVIAHRGASSAHPPGNTLAAFRAAADLGADGVELDVRRAVDGSLVVHHDPDLPDGRPIAVVSREDLPDWVPVLADALAVCAGCHLTVNVEIKNSPLEPDFDEDRTLVDDVLVALGSWAPSDVLISSFDAETVARVRRTGSEHPTGLLLWDPATMAEDVLAAAEAGHSSVNPWSPYVDGQLVREAHDLGLSINVWTVDDPQEMQAFVDLGVDAIITNVPDELRILLQ